ncbi:glycosyltransferase [uncultured Roseovarius sp.]|uniref:glycosyltransferase n=1 Tax=uncultured Roseovarius sp. TaxID=293344 RepID=UPI0026066E60|nr:glycosyltransferase [uncultured Roseovarius sp.]
MSTTLNAGKARKSENKECVLSKLLVISSAPATIVGGKPYLDIKFCEGVNYYASGWDGQVTGMLRTQENQFAFGRVFERSELSFDPILLDQNAPIDKAKLAEFDVILCSGDNHLYLDMWKICKDLQTKVVYIIEYDLKTRFQIISLNKNTSFVGKLSAMFWTLRQEQRRKTAFRQADGLQANGYPAEISYGRLCRNPVMYLDNRLKPDMMATKAEMSDRRVKEKNTPLRLVNSGRLEAMKGAQDLIPIANSLAKKKVDFRLDVFGTGSLFSEIAEAIGKLNLTDRVNLHEPVDFETELVPYVRKNADIFLSCHRQSDPSCTYLESMGCGVSVVGYDNRMLQNLVRESDAGWTVPLGNWEALADRIAKLSQNRYEVTLKSANALEFASRHAFDIEFDKRLNHLKTVQAQ